MVIELKITNENDLKLIDNYAKNNNISINEAINIFLSNYLDEYGYGLDFKDND